MGRSFFRRLALATAVFACGLMGSAQASTLFNFSETGSGISASGVLTTNNVGPGQYLITGISGSLNGNPILSLFAPGGFQGNDNLLFVPASPGLLDILGFAYTTSAGAFNVYYDATGQFITPNSYGSFDGSDTVIQFSVSGVPEPSTWAMMLLGFVGLGFVGFRRARNRMAIAAV